MSKRRDDVVYECTQPKCKAQVSVPRRIAEGMETLPNHKCSQDSPSRPKRALHPKEG